MINEKKIKFWDKFFWIAVALFVIPMVLYISSSESLSNNDTFNFILGFLILISIIMILAFRIGMVYNAYKIKRYGWMVVNLILGEIFVIIFYFAILRKEAEKVEKKKSHKAKKKN